MARLAPDDDLKANPPKKDGAAKTRQDRAKKRKAEKRAKSPIPQKGKPRKTYGAHTHKPNFGRIVEDCPRCQELKAGAAPKGIYIDPTPPVAEKARERMKAFLATMEIRGVVKACEVHNVHRSTIHRWRNDKEFAQQYDYIVATRRKADNAFKVQNISLEAFRYKILGRKTYKHMRQWQEWMEDDSADHVLIVTPPNAAKTTYMRDYILWRIAKEPTIRVAYASLSEAHAKKQLEAIRNVIEANTDLEAVAGRLKPEPSDPHPWAATHFMVAPRDFTKGEDEADATLRAFGMGSQIVGSRIDLFIIDDPDQEGLGVTQREEIYEKIMMNVESRLNVGGKLIVICNRWSENDVASRIIDQEAENPGLWKIHTTPAIIRPATPRSDKPGLYSDDGEVIWPEKFGTKTGVVGDPWTAKRAWAYFKDKRIRLGERRFAIQYQNDPAQDTTGDFTYQMMSDALERGKAYTAKHVPDDALVICAQDPAITEGCAHVAVALMPDRTRVVIDYDWDTGLRDAIYDRITEYNAYRPDYWVIEAQGPWKAYALHPDMRERLYRGCTYETFNTGANAYAGDIQVASMVPMVARELCLARNPDDAEFWNTFINQFIGYRPPEHHEGKRRRSPRPYDCVMALWLAERVIAKHRLLDWVGDYNKASGTNVWATGGSAWTGGRSGWSGGSFAEMG